MRNKTLFIGVGIGVVIGLLLAAAGIALAGNLNPSTGPGESGSQVYMLEQLYDRLATGAAGTKMIAFTEPSSGPGSTMHTLDDIMTAAPAVDNTNGAGFSDVASGKTFWGLTSGEWGLQTGSGITLAFPAPVPKTGQTKCYDNGGMEIPCTGTGRDGDLQVGEAWPDPRFTDNGNGTVRDNLTGLIWLKNANCWGDETWADALTLANGLASGSCGLTDGSVAGDWRLPNVREQQSLNDYGQHNGLPLGHPFTTVISAAYWTSDTITATPNYAWLVKMNTGTSYSATKTAVNRYYVWPVRGGQ